MVQRGVVQRRPQVAAVQRRPLAAHVGKPDGEVGRRDGVEAGEPRRLPSQRFTRSRNRPPALLGPPIIVFPGAECGMVQSPGTSFHSSITPQVMRVVPHSTSTSPVVSAPATSCSANASMVPPPTRAPAPASPGRAPPPPPPRPTRSREGPPVWCRRPRRGPRPSRRSRTAGAPSSPSPSRWHRGRTARGWPPPGPARSPTPVRRGGGVPGEEREQLAAVPRLGRIVTRPLAPTVAVEEARTGGGAQLGHGTERRHHGRHVDRGDVPIRGHSPQRVEHVRPPRLVDVVLELAGGRGAHLVGDPGRARRRGPTRRPPPPSRTWSRCRSRR